MQVLRIEDQILQAGHGHFDLAAYENYFEGKLEDYELPQEEIDRALKTLPQVG